MQQLPGAGQVQAGKCRFAGFMQGDRFFNLIFKRKLVHVLSKELRKGHHLEWDLVNL